MNYVFLKLKNIPQIDQKIKIKRKPQYKAKIRKAKIDAEKRDIEDQFRDPSSTRISGK